MNTTSVSLLERLREPGEVIAWERFVSLYAPLLFHWVRRQGLNSADTADLVQEVFALLVTKLPTFQYDPQRRFRGWLRTLAENRVRDFQRRRAARPIEMGNVEVDLHVDRASVDLFEEVEYRRFLVQRARQVMESDFEPRTWQACWKQVVEDRSAEEVGRELGISANAVRLAKFRVLRRLREELRQLID
jgi:RNA polymerase sigma-70 factor (ECF subfamily)